MRFPRIRRFSGWVAYCLCVLLPVLVGCGDYCLFCEGQGSGGGGNGNDSEEICDNVFPGLGVFQQVFEEDFLDTFSQVRGADDRLSLAVIPKGMSFSYPPNVENQSAVAGDVILADQQADTIFIYDSSQANAQQRFLTGYDQVSGLALLHQEVDPTPIYDLLFFSVNTDDALYIYDLTGTSPPRALSIRFRLQMPSQVSDSSCLPPLSPSMWMKTRRPSSSSMTNKATAV